MLKMDQFCDNLARLLQNPENYLRPNDSLYKSWIDQTTLSYNSLKTEENFYGLPASGEALPELYTDGLDMEQIWQQVELQNNTILAAPDDLTSLDDINLPYCVVKLNSRLEYDSMNNNIKDGESQGKESKDNPASEMEDEEEDEDDDDDDDNIAEDEKMEDEVGDDMDEDEEDDLDMDLDGNKKKPLDSLLNGDEFGDLDSSDFDEDHYDDLAPEGQEDEDDDDDDDDDIEDKDHDKDDKKQRIFEEDDDDEEGEEINNMKKSLEKDKNKMDILKKPDKFKSTTVDDSFFNLRESEWVADNDILGAELEGNLDDIDFFEDVTDEEEDAGAAMYNTFFDSIDKKKGTKKNNEEKKNSIPKSEDNTNKDEDENEDENKEESEESDEDKDNEEGVTKLLGGNKKEKKSTFEREQEKERQIIESLEEEQMTEKPWFLKGEVQSRDRPENSTLEEHLDYDIAAKQRPVITEDTTALVEKLILNRIRTQAFDDVERKVKPEANPFEYKKQLLLDQEKSKKSLAEIYEEEYIKKQKEEEDDDEEPKAHTEIKSMMDNLFIKLDALANYHFMPKHRKAEVKIVSNLPAVTMEEASPATATDASLLAPQEVLAPVLGELRSAGERTTTDKKRERRQKKSKQKARAKEEERKLSEKLKKVGGSDGKKLDVKSSAKVVQKAVKAGQVKMLSDNHSNKHIKSSQSFFKQLQDDVSSQINKKKDQSIEKKKKKKEIGQTTASKILL